MKVKAHVEADSFLSDTKAQLEANEVANGLMLGISERLARQPEPVGAPPCLKTIEDENGLVLAAIMTPPHKLVVNHHQGDLYAGVGTLIETLLSEGWKVPGVLGPSEAAQTFAERWTEITAQEHSLDMRLRLQAIWEARTPVPDRGRLRRATEVDTDLAAQWRYEFHRGIFGETDREEIREATTSRIKEGDIYLWEDERPVSMAMTTRPTRKGISVGLVYTPPDLRGRGYATACVGELSRMLLTEGWEFCALFVNVTNVPALRVYEKVGYRPVCDYNEYVFSEETGV